MKPLIFHFYHYAQFQDADGGKLDYSRIGTEKPVASLVVRPPGVRSLLDMHLRHLAFTISRHRPDLEGETLDVRLELRGNGLLPKQPVLVASRNGAMVAQRLVRLQTLDTAAFVAALHRRKPELKEADLLFAVDHPDEGGEAWAGKH